MASLEKLGWEVSDRLCPADIYVLNTCAVTREAEKRDNAVGAKIIAPVLNFYKRPCFCLLGV